MFSALQQCRSWLPFGKTWKDEVTAIVPEEQERVSKPSGGEEKSENYRSFAHLKALLSIPKESHRRKPKPIDDELLERLIAAHRSSDACKFHAADDAKATLQTSAKQALSIITAKGGTFPWESDHDDGQTGDQQSEDVEVNQNEAP
eukprot:TRINITY_DN7106_c0_g2_i1.p1 TRINITY_DN7106_c0_g2~~TRINITY_DN7106_c0_g2_i1.p1  ORF type:complete len:146 (+),score=25.37 TRINITY_DN7106_c0_g2_i1:69-506(+)